MNILSHKAIHKGNGGGTFECKKLVTNGGKRAPECLCRQQLKYEKIFEKIPTETSSLFFVGHQNLLLFPAVS